MVLGSPTVEHEKVCKLTKLFYFFTLFLSVLGRKQPWDFPKFLPNLVDGGNATWLVRTAPEALNTASH
jgi:hypothetical protein